MIVPAPYSSMANNDPTVTPSLFQTDLLAPGSPIRTLASDGHAATCCLQYLKEKKSFVTLKTYNRNITKSQLQHQKYSRIIRNSVATSSKHSPIKQPSQHQEHSLQHQNRRCNILYIKIYLQQQRPPKHCNNETFDAT